MTSVPTPTRRGVLAGIAALPVLGPAAAHAGTQDRARELAGRLAGLRLPYRPSKLTLLRYGDEEVRGEVHIAAVVQLTWAPGLRTRIIRVRARDYEAGIEAVELRAHELFADPSHLT